MADDDDKPTHKDKVIPARVPSDVADKARARAQREGRSLGEIIRSWLHLFADDEAPSPPKVNADRAPQRPETKPRRRRKKTDDDNEY